jgi:peroxiredoxin
LADYRNHYEEIRGLGANIVAISVDPPEKSEAVRRELNLPFLILCDTDRSIIREWDNTMRAKGAASPSRRCSCLSAIEGRATSRLIPSRRACRHQRLCV